MSGRPHIAHVIDGLAPGGAERMAVEIANATDRSSYEVTVCVTRDDTTLEPALDEDVGRIVLRRASRFDGRGFRRFSAFCRHRRVSVLHVHGRSSLSFIAFQKALGMLPSGLPVVAHDHFGDVDLVDRLPRSFKMSLGTTQALFVGVHERLVEMACRAGVPSNRAWFIRNAVDFSSYEVTANRQQTNLPHGLFRPFGIMVANVRPTKDLAVLFQAAQLVDQSFSVGVVGSTADAAYFDDCRKLIGQLSVNDRVRFLGEQPDVRRLLGAADFGLLTSKSESGPLVLLEYAASGLPFASTKVGSIGPDLCSRGIPEFTSVGDANAMGMAITRLLALGDEGRKERGNQGRVEAEKDYDISRVMPSWYEVYEQAVRRAK